MYALLSVQDLKDSPAVDSGEGDGDNRLEEGVPPDIIGRKERVKQKPMSRFVS